MIHHKIIYKKKKEINDNIKSFNKKLFLKKYGLKKKNIFNNNLIIIKSFLNNK
jgi:hypothetical protein